MSKKIDRWIDLSKLPLWGNNGICNNKFDWASCVGKNVDFKYGSINGSLLIVSYNKSKQLIGVKYLDMDVSYMTTGQFAKCGISKAVGLRSSCFKLDIGHCILDKNIVITDRKYIIEKGGNKRKYYKYKCLTCGFDCGKHYKNGVVVDEYWLIESNIMKNSKCGCCSKSSQIVVEGINDIPTTSPWMVKYFQGGRDEAKKYMRSSGKRIFPICLDCENIYPKSIRIADLNKTGTSRCICSDNISYPEKFVMNVLKQLKRHVLWQVTKKEFDWCKEYRYDFLVDGCVLLEVHGLQHYNHNTNFKMSLSEVQINDYNKKGLALNNGISEYIEIDCRYSELEFIKNNILNSRLADIYDLSNINWNECEEYAIGNMSKRACDMYNYNNGNISTEEIGRVLGFHRGTICRWLHMWTKLGKCNYYNRIKNKKTYPKKRGDSNVIILKDGVSIGEFNSCIDLARESMRLFGVQLNPTHIGAVANGKRKTHGGFTFVYTKDRPIKTSVDYEYVTKEVEVFKDSISYGVFRSVTELSNVSEDVFGMKLNGSNISQVANGKRPHHKGFTFKYVKNDN